MTLFTQPHAPLLATPSADSQLFDFNRFSFGQQQPLPFSNLLHAFQQQVASQPHAPALQYADTALTYQQLDQQSDQLAKYLLTQKVQAGDRVGLFLHRSELMVIAMLACFKVGATFVPQHAKVTPLSQLQYIVDTCAIQLVLTLSDYQSQLTALTHCQLCCLDQLAGLSNQTELANPTNLPLFSVQHSPDDIAFILFTSGTTGTPNGVAVSHLNVCNIVLTAPGNLAIGQGTKVGQILAISFDMAQWEIWACLGNGGELIIRGASIQHCVEQVDVVIATPSILQSLDAQRVQPLKTAIVAGEPCPKELAMQWSAFCTFYNSCGPTETTIVNTIWQFDAHKPMSIGTPTVNNNVYILDDDLQPLPIGEIGMMWAGGAGVTQGYINNDALNAQRYRDDPFVKGQTMFRTGDLARWNEYGELEHFGRADDQIKIKGFRVELDAVSRKIEDISGVLRAVTIKYDNDHLIAFYTGCQLNEHTMQAQLATQLAYYCVPSKLIHLAQLPQTERGKIDKVRLRAQLDNQQLINKQQINKQLQQRKSQTEATI